MEKNYKSSYVEVPIFVDECSSTVLKPRDVVSYQAKPLKHIYTTI